jgi:hypothetical protein
MRSKRGPEIFDWIVPEAFLRQMEAEFFAQRDEQFEVIERTCRLTGVVAAADVQHEAAVIFQNSLNLTSERQHPRDIVDLVDVAVLLLEVKRVRRRGDNGLNAACRQ